MRAPRFAVLAALAAAFFAAGNAQAQVSRGYIGPYAGVLIIDDGKLDEEGVSIDPAAIFGVTVGFGVGDNWEVAGTYGYAPATATFDEPGAPEIDAKIHSYYASLNYLFPSQSRARFFAGVGVGGFMIDPDAVTFEGETFDAESSNDLQVNVGAGVRYRASDRLVIQGVVRDHIQFCKMVDEEDEISLCPEDDAALNHFEISGGLLFMM